MGMSKRDDDRRAYEERAAELDRRIAGGETITEIMRAEQLERGKALIARVLELDAQDNA